MGSDKAVLKLPGTDELLWEHQLHTLRELGPKELFWSGNVRDGLPENVRVVRDIVTDAGPLGGIASCLEAMHSDLLIVLAVDLPKMTSIFLASLLSRCERHCGAVAGNGVFFEPLAAVYPKALAGLAREHLEAKRFALQDFVKAGVGRGELTTVAIEATDVGLFKNLNSPSDL